MTSGVVELVLVAAGMCFVALAMLSPMPQGVAVTFALIGAWLLVAASEWDGGGW